MYRLGELNKLKISRKSDFGLYLIDDNENEILLPNSYVDPSWKLNEEIDVFLFKDSEDRLTATTIQPKIEMDGFAYLKVVDVNKVGAFVDWGLPKDLFVPFSEQRERMQVNEYYPVTLYLDFESERLIASNKIEKFLETKEVELKTGQEVDLFVYKKTDLGFKAVINNLYEGLIYHNEIFQHVSIGNRLKGFVKLIRDDNKVDLTLNNLSHKKFDQNQEKILSILKIDDGFIPLNDKSDPKEIYEELSMSKKAFKKAIGGLYKKKLITIEDNGIYLNT